VSDSPSNPQRLTFASRAWEDYLSIANRSGLYWPLDDQPLLQRINSLIKEIQRQPFEGIGKPERLKHGLAGYWSRRINDEHRIVYKLTDDQLLIAQLRYHYEY